MSFIVSSSELQRQLGIIAGVVPNKSVLPIITNIHLRQEAGTLRLGATDLDNSMQTSMNVEPVGDEGMDVALPAKLLQDTLKALPEQPITFKLKGDSFTVQLSTDNGEYELTGVNGQDFPALPQPADTSSIEMGLPLLTKAIDCTLFAASSDELKPALGGMYFDFKKAGLTFVATDAHRLVRYRRLDVPVSTEVSFILPQKALKLIATAAGTSADTVAIEYNTSNAFFRFGTTELVCRLIDARFPDYENVIPKTSSSKLILNKKELIGTMRRLDIYSNKTTHLGRFKVGDNSLEVKAEDLDFANSAKETLHCLYEGTAMEIGFNVSLMMDIINNVESEDVVIELESPNRAAIVTPSSQESGEHLLMLLMPVMLNTL